MSIANNTHEITVVCDYDGVRKRINEAWKLTHRAGSQLDMSELAVNDKVMSLYSPDGRSYSARVAEVQHLLGQEVYEIRSFLQ